MREIQVHTLKYLRAQVQALGPCLPADGTYGGQAAKAWCGQPDGPLVYIWITDLAEDLKTLAPEDRALVQQAIKTEAGWKGLLGAEYLND
jgi:hypothetical protein